MVAAGKMCGQRYWKMRTDYVQPLSWHRKVSAHKLTHAVVDSKMPMSDSMTLDDHVCIS